MSRASALEESFAWQIKVRGLPSPVREHRPVKGRRWRFDFAWPALLLAVEVEGGAWTGGRHRRGEGRERDCEKYNEAAVRGWMLLRVTGDMVKDGRALLVLERALAAAQEAA